MHTVKIGIVCVLLGWLFLCPAGTSAQAVWVNGTITKAPWQDKYIHIGINEIPYTFLNKEIRIAQHYEVKPGMYDERKLGLDDLAVGKEVMIRAQGHRIYEIRVVE